MTDSFLKSEDKERQRQKSQIEPGTHAKELNPYWKTGAGAGAGSPSADQVHKSPGQGSGAWTRIKLQRTLVAVSRGEVLLEQAAVERFGSLQAFESLCRQHNLSPDGGSAAPMRDDRPRFVPKPMDREYFEDSGDQGNARRKREKCLDPMEAVKLRKLQEYGCKMCAAETCELCAVDSAPNSKVVGESDGFFVLRLDRPFAHLRIVPKDHDPSFAQLPRDSLLELARLKCAITAMLTSLDTQPLFIEVSRRPDSARQHAAVDCFAIGTDTLDVDPEVYFRKVLFEAESYWAEGQHRPVISCPSGDIRSVLPRTRAFPYVHVEVLGADGGIQMSLLHVVDDPRCFPESWARETAAKLDPSLSQRELPCDVALDI